MSPHFDVIIIGGSVQRHFAALSRAKDSVLCEDECQEFARLGERVILRSSAEASSSGMTERLNRRRFLLSPDRATEGDPSSQRFASISGFWKFPR